MRISHVAPAPGRLFALLRSQRSMNGVLTKRVELTGQLSNPPDPLPRMLQRRRAAGGRRQLTLVGQLDDPDELHQHSRVNRPVVLPNQANVRPRSASSRSRTGISHLGRRGPRGPQPVTSRVRSTDEGEDVDDGSAHGDARGRGNQATLVLRSLAPGVERFTQFNRNVFGLDPILVSRERRRSPQVQTYA